MNKKFWIYALVFVVTMGCNDELKVNADWKDVSIIYGVLNKSKTTNYIRIHRGYLGDEGIDAGSQNPDSLYYPELSVKINLLLNGQTVKTLELTKDESIVLDSGFFTTDQYHTYRIDRRLNGGDTIFQLFVDKLTDKNTSKPTILLGQRGVGKTAMVFQCIKQLIDSGVRVAFYIIK